MRHSIRQRLYVLLDRLFEERTVDVLAAVMRELHLSAASYRRLEMTAPWAISFGQRGLRGIHIVLAGNCEASFKHGSVRRLSPGDLVIAPRGDPHILRSADGGRAPVIDAERLATTSERGRIRAGGGGEATAVLCGAFAFKEGDHPALAGLPRIVHLAGTRAAPRRWLKGYVGALLSETMDEGPASDVVMAQLSAAILTRALRDVAESSDEAGWLRGLGDPAVGRALTAIHESCGRAWTLEGLARIGGLSRAAFAARFHTLVGEPPMGYLFRRRMRRAAQLLSRGKGMAHVADAVGYRSESAFAVAFKRHTGISPAQFRKAAEGASAAE